MATVTETNFRINRFELIKNEAGEWSVQVRVETITANGAVVREETLKIGPQLSAEGKQSVATLIKAARLALHEILEIAGTE
jgi:hypothetical protein